MIKKIAVLCFVLFLFSGCTKPSTSEKTRYEADFLLLFDTATKIVGYTNTKEEFEAFANLIYDELKVYHELYDIYNDYEGINNIKTINDNAGKNPVSVDPRIIELLLFAQEQYEQSKGNVNVALGPVLNLWHEYRERGSDNPEYAALPPLEKLQEANQYTDLKNCIVDAQSGTVFLKQEGMRLDVGAVAKGYAVVQVVKLLKERGYSSGLLSVGGNVAAIGSKMQGGLTKWNVGIQNPDEDSQELLLKVAYLSDYSIVTSGDYQRYYIVDGKKYHHIIDPKSLYPAEYFAAVSIFTPDSGLGDALSTAVFNMPYEEGLHYIESLPDTYAMWVFKDGEIRLSKGAEKLFVKE